MRSTCLTFLLHSSGPLITFDQMDRASVKSKDMTAARFRNALRNNYGDAAGDLPLQAIYNGVAKLILHD